MNSKKEKLSISNVLFITLSALFGIAWCLLVIYFLFCGNMTVSHSDVIVMCISVVCGTAGIYGILNIILSRIKKDYIKYIILLIVFTAAFTFSVISAPYSPTHDSLDLELILKEMYLGTFSGSYFTSYMNFFATNKLAVYIYYPFVYLMNDVQNGVRLANALFIWISSICISVISYRIKNVNAAAVSLIVMVFLCPVLLFCGPYIYPPAIMLSALSMVLYMHKEPFVRVFGYLFAGILFTMRPMSLGVLLVYVVCWNFYERGTQKRKILYTFLKTLVIILICFTTQWYTGRVMFLTGTHGFDRLDSSMTLWTLDVGTRDEGDQTGLCLHSPITLSDEEQSDEILLGFHSLWRLYVEPKKHYDEIKAVKATVKQQIISRIKTDILRDKDSLWLFLSRKFSNYYRDYYKPYFYTVNINSENASELLYKNYDYRYFLYENVFLILFYFTAAAGTLSTCIKVYRRKKNSHEAVKVFILFFGVICTSIMSILFTEVGKRLIFDTFVPMCVVISINILRFCKIFKYDKKKSKSVCTLMLSAAATIGGIGSICYIYNGCTVPIFKNCTIIIDEKRNVTIQFASLIEDDGYVFSNHYNEKIPMKGLTNVSASYIFDEYTARPVYFGFTLPNNEHIYISYFE